MKTGTTFIISLMAILTLAAGSAFGKYSGGSGTAGAPYRIATKANLLALAADTGDYGKCFILTADINMTGQVFAGAIIAQNTITDTYFMGTHFTGTFDGNGHKITNFTIKNVVTYSFVGLFGYINAGSVKNLGIEDCSVSGYYYAGGLAGYNNGGTISDCYSTGSVSGVSNSFYTGGLAGYNNGGSISNCHSTGSVSGASGSSSVGGLVGNNDGDISKCYAAGSVSASEIVGGLVGTNGSSSSSINNSYSMGSVSGSYSVGGLVGYHNNGSIRYCYSTGAVSGSSSVGGLVGYHYSGGVVSSFWDVNTSGQATSDGGTGKTTVQMKTLSTFTSPGWDFVETWDIIENQTYPYLMTGPAGDLNHDKKVDFADFAIFADNWLTQW